jgi:hypothetical protein
LQYYFVLRINIAFNTLIKHMEIELEEIKELILSEVKKDAQKRDPLIDDHQSLWGTLGDMCQHDYFEDINEMVDLYFEGRISLELNKLPNVIQNLLWLESDQGQDNLSDVVNSIFNNEKTEKEKLDEKLWTCEEETVAQLYSLLKERADEDFIQFEHEQENESSDDE